MYKTLITVAALGTALALGACNAGQAPTANAPAAASSATGTLVGKAIDQAMARASEKLQTENITISDHDGSNSLPKAQITPQGDLLIGDQTVSITAAQRKMLLDYRAQVMAIATQGMAIGKQGAALGMHAAGEALTGAFSGQSDAQIQQRVEAQTSAIKQSVAALCAHLPELMTSQQQLADALPAFKPYATMTAHDIDKCRNDALKSDAHSDR